MNKLRVLLAFLLTVSVDWPVSAQTAAQPDAQPGSRRRERRSPRFPVDSFVRVHDPSTIVREGDRYWLFYTGRGVSSLHSEDLKSWQRGPSLFEHSPDWVDDVVPGHRGRFWAPDAIKVGDRYLVYYSVSTFGKQTSAIALATSPALDPDDPKTEWTDRGIVVRTDERSDHNAIDPSLLLTSTGELWMAYGSFWSGIKLVQLDPKTGLRIAAESPLHSLAWNEQIEAPALIERDGYFYLFVNWGWCCRGTRSTYNIRVGRSGSVTGPYLDKAGKDLLKGGGSLVLEAEGNAIGPGHAGLIETSDGWRMSYHYYDAESRGRPRLGLRKVIWTEDGWPEVVADRDRTP